MTPNFDFIGPNDKPALVLINNDEWANYAKAVLSELGYKVHALNTHEDFLHHFADTHYQVVVIDESFGGALGNVTLDTLQHMPMSQRRHAVIVLIGASLESLNTLQAFQKSVHTVLNYSEISLLGPIIQKGVNEANVFWKPFRETAERVARGRARNLDV